VAGSQHTVGILALQGDVDLHRVAFSALGCDVIDIRQPHQLSSIDRLVIPGGESTALLKLMFPWNFLEAIKRFNKPIFGTCAGAILLASQVQPQQSSLELIDMTIERNAYGRQIDSFVATGEVIDSALTGDSVSLTFIRAPRIMSVGSAASVLVTHENAPVLVQQNNCLAATFHPEMNASAVEVLRYFLSL
jgi:pyridoxal 5'-phosphate synthase pdxT subunit